PPSLEGLQKHIPPIEPCSGGSHRPFWSVMIPTYNCAGDLRHTLASVLCQAPGPEEMQIEVVDDASTMDYPEDVVRELGNGRVTFFRHAKSQRATRTFNTCVQRSRGHWVHILHGDDEVVPGFYAAYRQLIEATPGVVMVTGASITTNEHGRHLYLN